MKTALKRTLGILLSLALVLGLMPVTQAGAIEITTDVPEPIVIIGVEANIPDGSQENPYIINGIADFLDFRDVVRSGDSYQDCFIELHTNIDLSNVCGKDIGSWLPIGTSTNPFAGTFDGCGHTITGLFADEVLWNADEVLWNDVALFGCNTGTVKNLTVEGEIKASIRAGGIVGNNLGRIENCTFRGKVTATVFQGGGIAGATSGTIIGCRNESVVKGKP